MTEMLSKEFSRKSFVKGGGAMIVGFSLAGAGLAGRATAAESPYASNGPTDLGSVDSWLKVLPDNKVTVTTSWMELGQGTGTALLQVVAEELDLEIAQVSSVPIDTNLVPNTGGVFASRSAGGYFPQLRAAAAYARQALMGLASTRLGVPVSGLSVKGGVVTGGGKSVTYGELVGGKLINASIPTTPSNPGANRGPVAVPVAVGAGQSPAKPVAEYKLVGTRVPRIDIPAKVTGTHTYIQNVRVPGMLHGRVVRPPGQYVFGAVPKPLSVDESSIRDIAGAKVVRKGDFVAVVAPTEYAAVQAAAQLKVTWSEPPAVMSGTGNLFKYLRQLDNDGKSTRTDPVTIGNADAALASTSLKLSSSYTFQHHSHATIGPSAAIADVTPNGARILTFHQVIFGVRERVAEVTGLPIGKVRINYFEGSSGYGSTPNNDAPIAAAVLSQLTGNPVRLQLMRWDETGWDSYGHANVVDIRGGIDANGKIVALDYLQLGTEAQGGSMVLDTPTDEALGKPIPPNRSGAVNATTLGGAYAVPNRRVVSKSIWTTGYSVRGGWLRSPQWIQGNFASETMIDELAYLAKMDPIAFRRLNVSGTNTNRWLAVLDALERGAKWTPQPAASKLSSGAVVTGRGVALGPSHGGGFEATAAEVEVNTKTGKVVVKHVYVAADKGRLINPGLVENQIVGATTMGISRTLVEEVRFNRKNVISTDFVTYPIMRFHDAPKVTPILVNSQEQPNGAGDTGQATSAAVVANAFFDATGVRIRQVPMTPAVVRAVLAANRR
jgi:CO/xanthine dehydrogenase Mo-binding subunit